MYGLIVPLCLHVDSKHDAQRGQLVLGVFNFQPVAVVKRRKRLFNRCHGSSRLYDGKVQIPEASRDLPAKLVDGILLREERKLPVELHASAGNRQLIRARNRERNVLHKADLAPLHVDHDELAPELEQLALDLIFDVSVFVPDIKMVEREQFLLAPSPTVR